MKIAKYRSNGEYLVNWILHFKFRSNRGRYGKQYQVHTHTHILSGASQVSCNTPYPPSQCCPSQLCDKMSVCFVWRLPKEWMDTNIEFLSEGANMSWYLEGSNGNFLEELGMIVLLTLDSFNVLVGILAGPTAPGFVAAGRGMFHGTSYNSWDWPK